MEAGDTFRLSRDAHLWIVISDPRQNRQRVAIVNLSSVKGNRSDDRTCILEAGCHAFIDRKTFVMYRYAQLKSNAELDVRIGGGGYEPMEPVRQDVLDQIREGVANSDRVPIGVRDLLDEQGLLPQ